MLRGQSLLVVLVVLVVNIRQYTSIYVNIRQYTSIFVNIRQYTSIYVNTHVLQPGFDTVLMVQVTARELQRGFPLVKLVLAHGTLRLVIGSGGLIHLDADASEPKRAEATEANQVMQRPCIG